MITKHNSQIPYHQATLDLLKAKHLASGEAMGIINRFEQRQGVTLPASVKEWYSLKHAQDILGRYPFVGTVRSLDQVGATERYWSKGISYEIDLLKQGLLLLMIEEQGTCFWAVRLNGEDDPPVVLSFEGVNPSASWHVCAETFSLFVYTCVWDSLVINPEDQLFGTKEELLPTELNFLRERYQEGPQTFAFPGTVNYRFTSEDQRILIQETKGQASWYFTASSDAKLKQLVEQVLQCETLKGDLSLERNGITQWEYMFSESEDL